MPPSFRLSGLRGRKKEGDIRPGVLAFVMIFPALVFLLLIIAYPVAYVLWLSLHEVTLRSLVDGVMPFVGIENYQRLARDPVFWTTLVNSLQFTVMTVALQVILGLGIALIINARQSGSLGGMNKVLMLLPWAVPPIANGLLWANIYNPTWGYLNVVLLKLGLIDGFKQFAGNPSLAMFSVVIAYTWRVTPFSVLLFHAALQGIPRELYEAAEVDGAGTWRTLRSITLPLLLPVILVVLVLRTGFAFMVFEEIFAITSGGPGNTTWVVSWYTYQYAFGYLQIGHGAAAAYTMAMIVTFIAAIYIGIIYRRLE